MAEMEVDDPPEGGNALSPRERIIQELMQHGIPVGQVDKAQLELVFFLQNKKHLLTDVIYIILPKSAEASKAQIFESLSWLQWLMFEHEPKSFLESLAEKAVGQRAVCGAVWGKNDLAYRCRTCEHDSTCAICVPCFQNGNHKEHDYSIMYTGGGCCDCGDITAWKREGFCSKHKGIESMQLVSDKFPDFLGPVLDALFIFWKDQLLAIKGSSKSDHGDDEQFSLRENFATELTSSVVDMLLMFCNHSESLLYFVSKRLSFSIELLRLLLGGESFLDKTIVQKLQELLMKLLGEPVFKYEFAKVFVQYYPHIINEAVKECSDSLLELYPSLATFSVQIFTVPSLTLRLVKEVNLLGVLQECLGHLYGSCLGENGCLQAEKWYKLYETTLRVVVDVRFTLSHVEVPKYVALEQPDAIKTWIRLLSHVQGMNRQKRATGLHIEEEDENLQSPFVLEYYLQLVNNLLLNGAFSVNEVNHIKNVSCSSLELERHDEEMLSRISKIGRHSQENSISSLGVRSGTLDFASASSPSSSDVPPISSGCPSISPIVISLISGSLKAIESWLGPEVAQNANLCASEFSGGTISNFLHLQKQLLTTKIKGSSKVVSRKRMPWQNLGGVRQAHHGARLGSISGGDSEKCDAPVHEMAFDDYLLEIDSDLEPRGIMSSVDWAKISFNVSSEEISFHIPLHRFLSLALQKAIELYSNENHPESASSVSFAPSSCHDFFKQILKGFHPYGFSSFLMEHPLRLRVFCAQVHAGMWRRNGDAGLILSELYHGVRWSNIGIETDLFLLQCCAALAPPELFVLRVLERFELSSYLSLSLSDYNEYEPVLVREMLNLFIEIVKERRFCGFSTSENLGRVLVQKLATGDATHSQLIKALPHDLSKIKGIQEVVASLATYTKPSGMKQGVYSLRKDQWKELDLYHPRWNVRDLQVAEERYLRFCKFSPLFVQVPRWTKIYSSLNSVGKIATSKMVLQIVRAVLFYSVYTEKPSTCRAPDDVLIRALHLLSLSLDICELYSAHKTEGDLPGPDSYYFKDGHPIPILAHATETISIRVNKSPARWVHESLLSLLVLVSKKNKKESEHCSMNPGGSNLSSLAEALLKRFSQLTVDCMQEVKKFAPDMFGDSQYASGGDVHKPDPPSSAEDRKAKARKHQAAMLEKMKAEQSKFIASLKSADDDEGESKSEAAAQMPEHITPACSLCRDSHSESPLSVITLLQKSRLSSLVDEGPPSWDDISQNGVQNHAPQKVIDQSTDDPVSSENLPMDLDVDRGVLSAESDGFVLHDEDGDTKYIDQLHRASATESSLTISEQNLYGSILEGMPYFCDSTFQLAGWQTVSDFDESNNSQKAGSDASRPSFLSLLESISHPTDASSSSSSSELPHGYKFGAVDFDGIYISSCGHAVHQECHDRYVSSLRRRGLGFEGRHLVDPSRGEFLCPVCRRFANSILPLLPDMHDTESKQAVLSNNGLNFDCASSSTSKFNSNPHVWRALSLLMSSAKMLEQGRIFNVSPAKVNDALEPALEPFLRKLCELYFHQENGNSPNTKKLSSLLLWDTLRYSLISTEISMRGKDIAVSDGSDSSNGNLFQEPCFSNGDSLLVLLHVAQIVRGLDRFHMQLRFKSLRLFASAICAGSSTPFGLTNCGPTYFMEEPSNGISFPGKFLKVAADPILIHDPFSSLMWIIFSLPLPFISSAECLLSLVHLFYVVCIIQALITCYCKHDFDASTFGECVLIDSCKSMGKSELARQLFVSHHIDDSHSLRDMVRKLTFPYLRRCTLLWKLLKLPTPIPLVHDVTIHLFGESDGSGSRFTEYGLFQLEKMFGICSLDTICNDKIVYALTSVWREHFYQHVRAVKREPIFYCNPAVPFQLMRLPLLYQDLLQRFIKERCPSCKNVPEEPALCLFCGRICSPNWKPCCSPSRCHTHAKRCGAGIGAFLLIKSTAILLQRSSRQSLWPSLYLDSFGEEDIGVSRGKPLYLSKERYSALTNLKAVLIERAVSKLPGDFSPIELGSANGKERVPKLLGEFLLSPVESAQCQEHVLLHLKNEKLKPCHDWERGGKLFSNFSREEKRRYIGQWRDCYTECSCEKGKAA